MKRSLRLNAELLQAYSRRGNFHSDPEEARRLGIHGLVAQGMQVAGPAFGLLLDEWGEEFLAHGELELKFVGAVLVDGVDDGQTVEADVEIAGDEAAIEVTNVTAATTAVVGTARRTSVL